MDGTHTPPTFGRYFNGSAMDGSCGLQLAQGDGVLSGCLLDLIVMDIPGGQFTSG